MKPNATGWHLDDDMCVDLVLELLPANGASAAVQHVEQCADCEQRVREVAGEYEDLLVRVHDGELRATLRRSIGAKTQVRPARSSAWSSLLTAFKQPPLRFAAGLAVVVLIVLLFLPTRSPNRDFRLLEKLPPFTSEAERRTELPLTLGDRLISGLDAYDRDDFDRAQRELRAARSTGPVDLYRQIYLASALALSGQYDESTKLLESLPLDLVPEPWSSEARWTLFVAFRASEQNVRADSLLHVLAQEPGEIGERARDLRSREE